MLLSLLVLSHVIGCVVDSPMRPIFMPDRARALSADWAPGPGVLVLKPNRVLVRSPKNRKLIQTGKQTDRHSDRQVRVLYLLPPVALSLMCSAVIPSSLQRWATSWAANMAAYGDDSSLSAFTFIPPVTRQIVSLETREPISHEIHKRPVYILMYKNRQISNDVIYYSSHDALGEVYNVDAVVCRGNHWDGVLNSLPGEVGNMDEGVVEGGEDVANSKHIFSFGHLRTQTDDLLLLLFLPFTRSHRLQTKRRKSQRRPQTKWN